MCVLLQNAAASCLKLKQYTEVEKLCNEALLIDGTAIKALHRRSQVCHRRLESYLTQLLRYDTGPRELRALCRSPSGGARGDEAPTTQTGGDSVGEILYSSYLLFCLYRSFKSCSTTATKPSEQDKAIVEAARRLATLEQVRTRSDTPAHCEWRAGGGASVRREVAR